MLKHTQICKLLTFILLTILIFLFCATPGFASLLKQAAPEQNVTWPVAMGSRDGKIKGTIYQGLKGNYKKEHDWIPVKVVVENTGAPTEITIVLSYEGDSYVRLRKNLSLQTGAKKMATFHFLVSHNDFVNISIQKNGKDIAWSSAQLNRQGSLTGVLTNNASDEYSAIDKALSTKTIDLSAFDIPEYGLELLPLNNFIISDFDTSILTKKQISAISEWVASGGNLLIFGGPGWKESVSGLDKNLLPVIPTGLTSANLVYHSSSGIKKTIDSVALTSAKLVNGSVSIIGDIENPVMAKRTIGGGNVIWAGFDASVVSNNADILQSAITAKAPVIASRGFNRFQLLDAYSLNDLMMRSNSKNISLTWLLIVMLLYLTAIVPVNYYFLKKYDRRELAWVTIPVIVVMFSFGMYVVSSFQKGTVSVLDQINFVELLGNEEGAASINTIANVFSASKQNVDLSIKGRYLMAQSPGYGYNPQNKESFDFNDSNQNVSALENINLAFWANKRFYFSGIHNSNNLMTLNSGIVPSMTADNNKILAGFISNSSPVKLKSVTVWSKPYIYYMGNIEPGQKAGIVKKVKVPAEGAGRKDVNFEPDSKGSNSHRNEIMSLILLSVTTPNQPDNRPIFLAWAEDFKDVRVHVSNKNIKGFNDTLIIKSLDNSSIDGLSKM